ncbi:hypothetical protein CAPTEDRAFT_218257 [Capitella teleta]|uniref:E3 ubiquitin-protein ligase CHFR n=1 Tax=Capitella teleta TaxID=283909 RepID=R7V4R8_CAPTE|nr:hypothetical protein CAPTEDRAFT_218257 [Capitella teleta]|eukprot:ELU13559.1 hypothetical protein CAPTEDRAFT_218257 [Capitella teleta]
MATEAWAQLVSTTDIVSDPTILRKDKFTIGRGRAADLCLLGNKYMSSLHCHILRDDDHRVYLVDTSTNGTLVNNTRIVQRRELLRHGDEISVVFKKKDTSSNVSFLFQDLKALDNEASDQTLEYSSDTLPDSSLDVDEDFSVQPPMKRLRTMDSSFSPGNGSCEAGSSSQEKRKTETKIDEKGNSSKDETKTQEEEEEEKKEKEKIEEERKEKEDRDALEETLICCICQELLHNCISLQPCMHSFCAGCYSEWMQRSKECPTCRLTVDRVNKNHIVNNLVEAYLASHPDKKRPAEDLAELDAKNKINEEMFKPPKAQCGSLEDSGEDFSDESDDDTNALYEERMPTPLLIPGQRVPKTVCRQCPEYTAAPGAGPSAANAPLFRCPANQVFCVSAPSAICTGAAVNLVVTGAWRDFKRCFPTLVLDNTHESAILQNYTASENMTLDDLRDTCVRKLESKEFTCSDAMRGLQANTVVCYACGLRNFKDLVYEFRKEIPKEELPAAVISRPDCHWGKNCRTQRSKLHHAQNFNHICDQTKFLS